MTAGVTGVFVCAVQQTKPLQIRCRNHLTLISLYGIFLVIWSQRSKSQNLRISYTRRGRCSNFHGDQIAKTITNYVRWILLGYCYPRGFLNYFRALLRDWLPDEYTYFGSNLVAIMQSVELSKCIGYSGCRLAELGGGRRTAQMDRSKMALRDRPRSDLHTVLLAFIFGMRPVLVV